MFIKIKNKSQLIAINNLIATLSDLNFKPLDTIFDSLTFSFDLPEFFLKDEFEIVLFEEFRRISFFNPKNNEQVLISFSEKDKITLSFIPTFPNLNEIEKYILSDIFEEYCEYNLEYFIFNNKITEDLHSKNIDISNKNNQVVLDVTNSIKKMFNCKQ